MLDTVGAPIFFPETVGGDGSLANATHSIMTGILSDSLKDSSIASKVIDRCLAGFLNNQDKPVVVIRSVSDTFSLGIFYPESTELSPELTILPPPPLAFSAEDIRHSILDLLHGLEQSLGAFVDYPLCQILCNMYSGTAEDALRILSYSE